ncbi:MAG: UvrD-helicase domain-containing protein [Spirochaetales bacterium]|nr:UvrD-helicase domain-containing protein [Spirochaetales bacterium]
MYLAALNEQQRAAVLHSGGPLLILAGAGSGKTRVVTTRIAYALDDLGADPASILAVTFTNKAAAEMRERLAALTPRAHDVLIKTFHAFGAWVLRRFGGEIGIDRGFLVYDESDSLSLLKAELGNACGPAQIRGWLSLISRAKDLGLGPDADERELRKLSYDRRFPEIYARYEERLRATGNLDFGDLILHALRLLKESQTTRDRLRRKFAHVLVDEYQDSNTAQFELLKELVAPSASLVVVGDDDQSIYGFRGAEVENILTFPDSFSGTEIIRLEENYRSTRTILAAASAVVAHNSRRMGKTLITKNEAGNPVHIVLFGDYTEEALYAARLVERNPQTETAILYRTNYQSRIFEEVFGRLGIPYLLVGSVRFYEREEVKDTLAYLSLMTNPRDEVAARRIINKPTRGIGEKTEEKAMTAAATHGGDVLAACRDANAFASGKTAGRLRDFAGLIDGLHTLLAGSPLTHFIHEVIRKTELLDLYTGRDEAEGTSRAKNLEELVNAAAPYGQGEEALREFLENTLLSTPEYGEAYGGRVTLITLHNTKGLEFERVIISGLEEGVFPSERKDGDGDIEEERRLFYVGLTRAKRELVLTACRNRLLYGQPIRSAPSRFLDEIPPELVVKEDLGGGSSAGAVPGRASGAWPPGTRVYSYEYGQGYVETSETKDGHEVVTVHFETGRTIKILPKYHDLIKAGDE